MAALAHSSVSLTDAFGVARKVLKLIDNGDNTFFVATLPMPFTALNIAGAATTNVKSGAGILGAIIFNKLVATGVITIYDSLTATGTKLATITNPAVLLQSQLPLAFNCKFDTGLTIVTSAADDITVMYL
jgi:hypothetical protein